MDIVRLIYRPVEPQGASKTCDFSRAAMEERWQQGTSDARKRRSKGANGCALSPAGRRGARAARSSGRPSRRRSKCRSPAANSMLRSSAFSADEVPGGLYVAAHENAERDL